MFKGKYRLLNLHLCPKITVKMAYRVELASTKRAICKNTECKKASIKIDKGELRYGSWVNFGEHQGWTWRHWGCVTPKQIESLKTAVEDDVSMLDGYEELPDDLREKVKLALENGHVADEDWRGDPEQNRPGKRGFRSPAPKKSKTLPKKSAVKEGSEEEDEDQSPSKPAPKKRGRAKKEDSGDENDTEPAKKKAKPSTKKGKTIKDEGSADEMAVDEQATGPIEVVAKNAKNVKGKDDDLGKTVKPKSRAAIKKDKVKSEEDAVDDITTAATGSKKPKAAGKKGQKKAEADAAEAGQADEEPKKAAGRPRKAKMEDVEKQSPAGELKTTKNSVVTKNAANTKKPVTKKAEHVEEAEITKAPTEDALKVKKGRKKGGSSK